MFNIARAVMNIKKQVLVCLVMGISALSIGQIAFAQENNTNSSDIAQTQVEVPQEEPVQEAVEVMPLSVQDDTDISQIPSLFFTPEALALIRDAIEGLNSGNIGIVGEGSEKDPGIRELALGGIVYKKDDEWTIWLNGRRITPDTIPGEIFDMTVYEEYVDLKWYDAFTNRLFPVRLRANERFNLDSRLFLTGTHSDDQQL